MENRSVTPPELQSYYDDWRMSPGVVSNGLMFVTGMTGRRADGVMATDPEEQITDVFNKIGLVLTEASVDWSALVEMTSFHVGAADHLEIFKTVRNRFVVEPYPAWTAVEVAGFVTPGAIVEIRVIATVG